MKLSRREPVLDRLKGGLVVSCQADPGEPLDAPHHIAALAASAMAGGAVGIRAKGLADLRAVRAALPDVPLIGLVKVGQSGVYITPTLEHADQVADTGADIVALDGTGRPRPDGLTLAETIAALHRDREVLVMADVSTEQEGHAAEAAGADLVGTTLSGYTEHSTYRPGPDLALVARLAGTLRVPVIAEGRIATPEQAREAIDRGAYAVVVGGAITRPSDLTAQFARALETP
ncbi:MAG: N-acetylmannosamine-6-phosphate 2-epimerase [Micromonosporaceae bacterium]